MRTFRDRVAVVTGAASGIGRATSVELAQRGCQLALADVDAEGLEETARQVRSSGRQVSIHRVDVSDKARMQELPDEVFQAHGGVHILVNNAGVAVQSRLEDHDLADFEWLMGINFWGVVYGCKYFLPYLKRADEAHIVNVSSLFGLIGVPTQTAYCSAKFAVRGFSEALWAELRREGIGVTSVHPGGVRTNIVRSARVHERHERDRSKTVAAFDKRAMPPEAVARQIVDAVHANRMRLLVTPETHVLEWLKRQFPVMTNHLLYEVQRRTSQRVRGARGSNA